MLTVNYQAHELAALRKQVEERRIAEKREKKEHHQQHASTQTHHASTTTPVTATTTIDDLDNKNAAPPGKTEKNARVKIRRPESMAGDTAKTSMGKGKDGDMLHRAEDSSHRQPQSTADEVTSAFIIPDITMHRNIDPATTKHDGKKCTICNHECHHGDGGQNKAVFSPADNNNEEPTTRPSEPPAAALAKVVKSLEDERAHSQMNLAALQAEYNNLDVSMGKRKRKALLTRIFSAIRDDDLKADRIYSLRDVGEGLKKTTTTSAASTVRPMMTEREMETTLQSLGIDVSTMGRRNEEESDGDDDGEADEELPWEGFESTEEVSR